MVKKLNRVLSIALILAIIGIGVFWMLQRGKHGTARVSLDGRTSSQMEAEQSSREWVQNYLKKRELTAAENRKVDQVMESPAYQAFLATRPNSMKEFSDFFASQGVEFPQARFVGIFHEMFGEQFPEDSAAELEPSMREKLSTLFWEHNIQAGADTDSEGVEDVIVEFFVEDSNIAWAMAHFEGDYFEISRWATDVLQHSVLSVTEEAASSDAHEVSVPAKNKHFNLEPSERVVESQADEELVQSALEGFESIPIENGGDIKTELMPEASVTEESLETSLRGSFSPVRFNRAMEILNRYGPEEGPRRLQSSDAEVAEHVTRFLRKQQEEK